MDWITCNCYQGFCDTSYERNKPLEQGKWRSIFCYLEDISFLFAELEKDKNRGRGIVVVSGGSDFGLYYQKEAPVNADIHKYFYALKYDEMAASNEYVRIMLDAADYERCNINDKFSIKIDRFTACTFNTIPECVDKWYCTNLNVTEEKIKFLPFGINYQGHGKDIVGNYYQKPEEKFKRLYVNFEINSYNRIALANYYKQLAQNPNPELCYSEHVNIEQYYTDMSDNAVILAPTSNGADSYRIWESLIVGSIPVTLWSRMIPNMWEVGLEVVGVTDLRLQSETLHKIIDGYNYNWNRNLLTQSYWKKKIQES
jgi:hypothetical protein